MGNFISTPGWKEVATWFPTKPADGFASSEWRLDVVTLLAVIGESSMTDHAQAITASALCLLPRMLPAPQVLLKPSRPLRMPQTSARVVGVFSGVVLDTVGFFANIIHPLDTMEPFAFRVLQIEHRRDDEPDERILPERAHNIVHGIYHKLFGKKDADEPGAFGRTTSRIPGPPGTPDSGVAPDEQSRKEKTEPGATATQQGGAGGGSNGVGSSPNISPTTAMHSRGRTAARATGRSATVSFSVEPPGPRLAVPGDLEQGSRPPEPGIRRRSTVKSRVQAFVAHPGTLADTSKRPHIPAALWSPIHLLAVFSMCLTMALLLTAISYTDGPAILAVSLISIQSALVGYASWWHPELMKRSHTNAVPRGDVMIRTREGAFIYVRCTEEVARELYTAGMEECKYRVGERVYRLLMGMGTIVLMISTVLLGNCSWNMQLFVGSSYISLNAAYWAMGMLPRHLFWDLSRYKWKDVTPLDAQNAHKSQSEDDEDYDHREGVVSFTRTLWYAVRETGLTGWVGRSGAAPQTALWEKWLQEAEKAAQEKKRDWKAVARKNEIFGASTVDGKPIIPSSPVDGGNSPAQPPEGPVGVGSPDPGKQHAPLTEVQPQGGTGQVVDSF